MIESLKPYLQVASALSEITRDRAREAARHALSATTPSAGVLPGASTVETVAGQIGALADELVATSRANRAMLTDLVRAEVESVLTRMGLTQHAELQAQLAATNARVRELERELAVRDAQDVGAEAPPPPPPAPAIRRDSVEEDAEAAARQAVVKRAATKKAATKKATAKKATGEKAATKKATTKAAAKTAAQPPVQDDSNTDQAVAPRPETFAGGVPEPSGSPADAAALAASTAPTAKRGAKKTSARTTSAATGPTTPGTTTKGTAKKASSKRTTAKKTAGGEPTARGGRRSAAGQATTPSADADSGAGGGDAVVSVGDTDGAS